MMDRDSAGRFVRTVAVIGALATALLAVSVLRADTPTRKQSDRFKGPRQEPPDRVVDALHLALEVSFDWEESAVDGTVVHRFRSLRRDLKKIELDAVKIDVHEVTDGRGRRLEHESFKDRLRIRLAEPVARTEEFEVKIRYRCHPKLGVYFRKPVEEAPDRPKQIWTQGEALEARHWIPCQDHPVDKLTSEITVHAPGDLMALSNGRLKDVRKEADESGRIFHWVQEKPHATYLIAVVVGEFAEYKDAWEGIEIRSFVPLSRKDQAKRSFESTGDMMAFFSDKLGYPYPWHRYDQICVHEFLFGGMENTTLTILTEGTLHDEAAAQDVSSRGLVAHELAHQWFGDLVTCKDWAHIWLNESFATFLDNQYRGHHLGWDEEVYGRKENGDEYLEEDRNRYRRALVTRRYRAPGDMFDSHAYPKGARIIAMLMNVVGEESFWAGLQHFLKGHEFTSVETEDLRLAMEAATGRSLQWFFDQWVYSGGHPEYRVSYEWDEDAASLKLKVEQTQKLDELTTLFRMPVDIEITTPAGKKIQRVEVSKREETFTFPCAERPRMVRFDKHGWILKELDFSKSREELLYQLEHDDNILGRLRAAESLAKLAGDSKARAGLLRGLKKDSFWGVRVGIALALGEFSAKEVRSSLQAAYRDDGSSKVREAIVQALGEHDSPEANTFLRSVIADDSSYYVVAKALGSLVKIDAKNSVAVLFEAVERESHRDTIRSAAVRGLGELEKDGHLAEEQEKKFHETVIRFAQPRYSVRTRSTAFEALGRVGKGEDAAYGTLIAAVDDPFLRVRMNVFEALGRLGDPRAVEVLQKRRTRETHRVFRSPLDTINEAIRRIETGEEESDLEDEVRKLRKEQGRLQKRIEELEERKG